MRLDKMLPFRSIWIGAAMLWIIFFHSGLHADNAFFRLLQNFGYGGVDICLFASGIGCYYSLEKDSDILHFLQRRLKRLGPIYICFIIPWLCWKNMVSELPPQAILGNLLGIQTLVSWDHHFNWYIGGLVVFYLCMPYLKRITDFCEKPCQDILAILVLTALGVPFWRSYGNALIILSRFPVLYMGMVFAKMTKQGYILKKTDYLIQVILVLAGVGSLLLFERYLFDDLWSCGLYWYPFALITPGICMISAVIADYFEKYRLLRWVNTFLGIVGKYSFEVYLIHVFLYEGVWAYFRDHYHITLNNLQWLLTLPLVAAGSLLLNRVADFFCIKLMKNKEKA